MASGNGTVSPTLQHFTLEEIEHEFQKIELIIEKLGARFGDIEANQLHWPREKLVRETLEFDALVNSTKLDLRQLNTYLEQLIGGCQRDEFRRRSQLAAEELQSMEETLLNESKDTGSNPYGSLTPVYIQLFKDIVEAEARVMLQQPQNRKNIALFTHYIVGCKKSFWMKEIKERHPSWNKQRIDKLSNTFIYRQNHSQVVNDVVGILKSVGVSANLVHLYEVLAGYRSTGKSRSDGWEKASPSQIALLTSVYGERYEGYFAE